MKKSFVSVLGIAAIVAALSIPALAQEPSVYDNTGSAIAQDEAVAVDVNATVDMQSTENKSTTVNAPDGSYNTKTENVAVTKSETEDSNNTLNVNKQSDFQNDKSKTVTVTDTKNEVEKSYNTVTKTDVEDSYNTSTSSINDSVNISNVNIAVSSSILSGEVSGNYQNLDCKNTLSTGNNRIENSFGSAAGITAAAQNTGINSLVQQSVNVQSNLTMGP